MTNLFKNVGDWADYNRLTYTLGYGDDKITDIEGFIKDNWEDPEYMIAEMKKGRIEHRDTEKTYDWKETLEKL